MEKVMDKYADDQEFRRQFQDMIDFRKIQLIKTINELREMILFISTHDKDKLNAYMKELDFLDKYDEALTIVRDFEYDFND